MVLRLLPNDTETLSDDGRDAFGSRDYAEAVVRVVKDVSDQPFTLGLFAPWGHGKTSILDEVGRQLKGEDSPAYVIFDVWRYEGDALRRQFLLDVAGQLKRDKRLRRRFDVDQLTRSLTADVAENEPRLRFVWPGLALAVFRFIVLAVVAYIFIRALRWNHPFDQKTLSDVAASLAVAIVMFIVSTVGKFVVVDQRLVTVRRVEDSDLFAERFKELLSALIPKKLVIAVDNLDRCAPDRVAEVLATIKTFLEPAGEERDVLFIIAADDEAIRRHLLAQEFARSALSPGEHSLGDGSGTSPESTRDRAAVEDAVEEYLRKFFSGRIRVADLLPEDTRAFATDQLGRSSLGSRLANEPAAAATLVEFVAGALKHNPRRIKQFFNNVELRLQVIEARQRAGRIDPPISDQVLMIAKLEIIEEQFPERFRQLRKDPRLLEAWLDDDGPDSAAQSPDFMGFLRLSRDVTSENVAAFITLKQSQQELELPRFHEFRDALRTSAYETVTEILDEGDDRGGYLALIRPQLLDELGARRSTAAANLVRSVIEIDAIRFDAAIVTDTLHTAIPHRDVLELVVEADTEKLLDASDKLTSPDHTTLLNALTQPFATPDAEGALAAMSGLGSVAARLLGAFDQSHWRGLQAVIDARPASFHAFLPFLEADPTLAGDAVLEAALDNLNQNPEFRPEAEAFRVARLILAERPGAGEEPSATRLTELAANALGTFQAGDSRGFNDLAREMTTILDRHQVTNAVASGLISRLEGFRPSLQPDQHMSALDLVVATLRSVPAPDRATIGRSWIDWMFDLSLDNSLAHAPALLDALDAELRGHVLDRLTRLASGEIGNTQAIERATDLLIGLGQDERSARLGQAVSLALDGGRADRAIELLNRHGQKFATEAGGQIQRLTQRISEVPPEASVGELDALTRIDTQLMTDSQLDQLRDGLIRAFRSSQANVADRVGPWLDRLSGQSTFAGQVELVLDGLLEFAEDFGAASERVSQWHTLDQLQRQMTDRQRHRVAVVLKENLDERPSVTVASIAQRFSRLSSRDREQIAGKLVALGENDVDPGATGTYLLAAHTLAPRNGPAREYLRRMRTTLGESNDPGERALAGELAEKGR